jgi:hypothetical protein
MLLVLNNFLCIIHKGQLHFLVGGYECALVAEPAAGWAVRAASIVLSLQVCADRAD